MINKLILPVIAFAMLAFAVGHALVLQQPEPETPPPVAPPQSPFGNTVAGAGMVEPASEASGTGNIAIGSQLAGVVVKVHVRVDPYHRFPEVKANDLLFELDPRQTEADLKVREATVVANEAQVEVAESNLRMTQDQYERARKLLGTGAVDQQDFIVAEEACRTARAQLVLAKSNVTQAKAMVEQDRTQLELLNVRAPVDGSVLQVNVRPGEYVSTFAGQALILMGSLKPLYVRVNVDEEDLPRLRLHAPARAKIRGDDRQQEIPLTYVRLEPYVVPKTSLTGTNTERVDTRVVQVIYAIDPNCRLVKEQKVLVGQLLDVFIDTRPGGQ